MSDTTLRLAKACERAAEYARVEAQAHGHPHDVADWHSLRALAAALRRATPYDFDSQHRDDQFILTIGDV